MTIRCLTAAGLVALLAPLGEVAADDSDVGFFDADENADRRARAVALFSERRYDEALDLYRAAYANHPSPDLLYLIGRAAHAAGRPRLCVDYLKRYLALAPDAPPSRRADAERRIRNLSALFVPRTASSSEHERPPPPGARLVLPTAAARPSAAPRAAALSPGEDSDPDPEKSHLDEERPTGASRKPPRSRVKVITAIVLLAVGHGPLAIGGAGVLIAYIASAESNPYYGSSSNAHVIAAASTQLPIVGPVVLTWFAADSYNPSGLTIAAPVVAGVMQTAGVALLIAELVAQRKPPARVQVLPWTTPGNTGVMVAGTF